MVFVLLVLLFMIFERTSIEITWPFCVSITLELKWFSEHPTRTERGAYPHGPFYDGDDIV